MPATLRLTDFRAVLFDIDGTLVDTLQVLVRGLGDAYERFSGLRPPEEEIRSTIGLPLRAQLQMHRDRPATEEELEGMIAYTIERFEAGKHHERPVAPAIEALEHCVRAGLKTCLVTSKSREEYSLFAERFAFTRLVDCVICASDVSHPKPHPESVLVACERLGVSPSEAVMIGDSTFDVECAHLAGSTCVAVSYGANSALILRSLKPRELFTTPEELLAWVKEALKPEHAQKESCIAR